MKFDASVYQQVTPLGPDAAFAPVWSILNFAQSVSFVWMFKGVATADHAVAVAPDDMVRLYFELLFEAFVIAPELSR